MQDYQEYTKEELILQMTSLTRLNKELLQTIQESERLEFGWTGNLGQWFWDFTTNEVTFNPLKAEAIGYMKEDLPEKVPYQFFTDKVHPDDKDEVMQQMTNHLTGKTPVWEVKYRIQAKDGSWKVYQDRGKVTERNEKNEPLFLKGIVFDITQEEQERELLKVKNKNLTSRMKIDTLTSLRTRSSIIVELVKHANRSKKEDIPLSVMVLNVDNYTKYEEDFGIVLSEEILKVVGQVIKAATEDKYVAGRYRDSVFLILLENTQIEEALILAETIKQTVLETVFDVPHHITISGGISTFQSEEAISELIQKVAKKLVAAQKNGGNQIVI
ncbi:sensor domain-containing diguanylate cyclase [Carnobacterium antarcticum]|uniref:Diguanylate cyclase domain-containing protein n=1 Tax=Carnobacterium antarcticum TaxID=2126436 RepID=A0ABW4NLM8_9LACT|nr:sensor domain-containing diguanylate cyclase [Carnobacterium sp. CP1]ALV22175.1 Signal transduction histidine kinase [Carnobacterium sp. CP1]